MAEPLRAPEVTRRRGRDGWTHLWLPGQFLSVCGVERIATSRPELGRRLCRRCHGAICEGPRTAPAPQEDPRITRALELLRRFKTAGCTGEECSDTHAWPCAIWIAHQVEAALAPEVDG